MYMTRMTLTPEVEVKVKKYQCSRCGHLWQHRGEKGILPLTCPKCKSPYWNRERVRPETKKARKEGKK
jgi:predicted Zn-ribbon and HTH transcriptional regulator